jgi:SagB-type dehydrogenase family enzyme
VKQLSPLTPLLQAEQRQRDLLNPWELYHEASKLHASAKTWVSSSDRIAQALVEANDKRTSTLCREIARRYRHYPHSTVVELPLVSDLPDEELGAVLRRRRTTHAFEPRSIGMDALGTLLKRSLGLTHWAGETTGTLRAYPSPGALYALETYVLASRLEGVPSGQYHYSPFRHALSRVGTPEIGEVASLAFQDSVLEDAAFVVVFTMTIERLHWKYGDRAYRLALQEVGHAAQNLHLVAESIGLGCCPIGGFLDDEVSEILALDGASETPVYLLAFGAARQPVPSDGESSPVLRRAPHHGWNDTAGWSGLDDLLRRAFEALCLNDRSSAREGFIRCEAALGSDRTLAEYLALSESADPLDLGMGEAGLFAWPAGMDSLERQQWISGVDDAAKAVCAFLGVERIPCAFVDLRSQPASSRTENWNRFHRKILFAREEADRKHAVHELMHSSYLPHNRCLAEGLAMVASASESELDAIDVGVSRNVHDLDSESLLLGRWDMDEALDLPSRTLAYAASASLIRFLIRTRGKARLFRLCDRILYPYPVATTENLVEVMMDTIGLTPAGLVQVWKDALCVAPNPR